MLWLGLTILARSISWLAGLPTLAQYTSLHTELQSGEQEQRYSHSQSATDFFRVMISDKLWHSLR